MLVYLEAYLANMPAAAKAPVGAWALVQPAVATDSDSSALHADHWSVRARGSRAAPRGAGTVAVGPATEPPARPQAELLKLLTS